MAPILILATAALLAITAIVHSALGEVRVIRPILASRAGPCASAYGRMIVRFAWHMMSVAFLVIAAGLAALALAPGRVGMVLLAATGIGIGGMGLFDLVASKGRHVGWPLLVLAGACALAALA